MVLTALFRSLDEHTDLIALDSSLGSFFLASERVKNIINFDILGNPELPDDARELVEKSMNQAIGLFEEIKTKNKLSRWVYCRLYASQLRGAEENLNSALMVMVITTVNTSLRIQNSETEDHLKLHKALWKRIKLCKTAKEFAELYDSLEFQTTMTNLRRAQFGRHDVDQWAKQWAIRMRSTSETSKDSLLNQDRRVALGLLYKLCDCWKDDTNKDVVDSSIVEQFQSRRVDSILELCLPMDRAQSLYRMQYNQQIPKYGMHWISKVHVKQDPSWAQKLEETGAKPDSTTMNIRLLWLAELEGLGMTEKLKDYLKPQEAVFWEPWSVRLKKGIPSRQWLLFALLAVVVGVLAAMHGGVRSP